LYSIWFTNSNTGYAVGNGGILLKTSDGGISWNELTSGTYNYLLSVRFTDDKTGYLVGGFGTILKITDEGIISIEEHYKKDAQIFSLSPNPSRNIIKISSTLNQRNETTVTVIDMTGKQLINEKFPDQNNIDLGVSRLSAGLYMVRIKTEDVLETINVLIQD